MSRMLLYLDKPRQPSDNETAIYPIYELDLQGLADARMVSWGLSGQVTNAVNECHYLSGGVNNANVNQYLSTNIPHQQWQDGSILQARISKYFLNENNVYVPDPEYYDFEEIPIGQQPDDWGTASNYMKYQVLSNATIGGQTVTYRAYYNVLQTATWDASAQYVRDKNRKMIRLFYTENGYNFGVYQGADSEGGSQVGPVFNVAGYSQYSYDFSNPYESRYIWCNPSRRRLSIGGNVIGMQLAWYSRTDTAADKGKMIAGTEPAAASFFIFVHASYNDKDYYGTLCIYPNDASESPVFTQINFALYTGEFWGESIISGGGGGSWGQRTIPTVNDGTFDSVSDSVAPNDATWGTVGNVTNVNNALSGLFSALTGVYNIFMVDTASGSNRDFSEFAKIFGVLYETGDNAFLNRFKQSMYNPLSAVISCHLLPYNFAANALYGALVTKKMSISGYSVSDRIAEKYSQSAPEYNILKPLATKIFDTHNMENILGGWADFAPYTQCILHLPFIGAVEVKTNAIAHGQIKVEYICDIISGNVCARIWCNDYTGENYQYVQTASGNCAYNLPLFSMNQDGSAVGKVIAGVSGIVTGALSGNPVSIATGTAGIIGGAIESSFSPRSTQISGEMGGNNMLMSHLDVWLEIIRPTWTETMHYQKLLGIPSGFSNCIADSGQGDTQDAPYNGFLQIEKIDLDNVPCTEQEKQEIDSLLKQGVFIRGDEIL